MTARRGRAAFNGTARMGGVQHSLSGKKQADRRNEPSASGNWKRYARRAERRSFSAAFAAAVLLAVMCSALCFAPLTVQASESVKNGTRTFFWPAATGRPAAQAADGAAGLYFSELSQSGEYEDLDRFVDELLPEGSFGFSDYIFRVLSGEESLSFDGLRKQLSSGLSGQLAGKKAEFVRLLGIVLLTAVFTGFSRAFRNGQVAESGYYVSYLMLFSMLAAGYLSASGIVSGTLDRLLGFMKLLVPVFCATLAFSTGVFTSQAASATLLMILALADYFIIAVLLPGIHLYMMSVLANHLTEEEPLGRLSDLLARGIRFAIKAVLGFVAGISVLQSMITPVIDQAKRKSAIKISEMIPGLGNLFSGVTETVLGAGNVIKNAVGTGGMIVILLLCAAPLIRVLLSALCYRAGAAIVEPAADKRIVRCLSDTAEGITMLFQALAAGAVLFLLALAILVRATS